MSKTDDIDILDAEFSKNLVIYDTPTNADEKISIKSNNTQEYIKNIIDTKDTKNITTLNSRLKNIIDKNKYINETKVNKDRDVNSLSYLIKKQLSQSECIRLGTAIEKLLIDLILDGNPKLKNIKTKNEKGKKEKDNLFSDDENKIIFYAEIKSNLNLDTEKSVSTVNKCIDIKNELKEMFIGYEIRMFLVGIRYYEKEIIPANILKKYTKINDNLVGINNYFNALSVDIHFMCENDYADMLNYVANLMFE